MQQNGVVFPVHHQLLVNHLAFELVASVVVFAVILDLVSTPDAHVLVPVLVPPASPVVLVLDETAVALDPVLVVFSMRTVVVIVVFAAATVSVAAVVSGPAVWVQKCLERSSGSSPPILISISRISRSAGDAIRRCSFAHLIAVAR